MMNRVSWLTFTALMFGVLTTGCGSTLVPFTHETRVQHGLSKEDLKNLQYYVSHTITLRRELESGGRQVTGSHKLRLVSGKTIEEVVIEEKTPGIAVAVNDRTIAVSFEQGSSLIFAASSGPDEPPPIGFAEPPPDPFPGSSSRSNASERFETFGGTYWLSTEGRARAQFQGTVFAAVDESVQAHLMIDSESLEEVVRSRKVLSGVRLPNQ